MNLLEPALAKAIDALKDPKVREQILTHGKAIADAAQTWRAERETSLPSDEAENRRSGVARLVVGRFGQQKLERRVANLRQSVETLSLSRPDIASPLVPVLETVNQLSVALEIAKTLPVVKRKRAHIKIDDVLDTLESELFSAALPGRDRNAQE